MKILITTCGVGIGHSSRDVALAKLLEKKGHKIYFASYGTGLHYLQKNNYKPYNLPPMNFHHEDGVLDIEKSVKKSKDIPFTFIKSMYRESRIIKKIKPDLIITDSLYSPPITAKFLNVPCYIITNDLTFGFSQNTNMTSIKYFEKSIRKFIIEISKSTNKILIPDIPESITIPKELEDKTEFIGPLLHKNPQEIDTKENLRRKYGLDNNEIVNILSKKLDNITFKNTICSATKTRQQAAKELSVDVDCMIVIGGKHISNTQKLVNICKEQVPTFAIETKEDLDIDKLNKFNLIGVTAGASTPDWIIEDVISFIESL